MKSLKVKVLLVLLLAFSLLTADQQQPVSSATCKQVVEIWRSVPYACTAPVPENIGTTGFRTEM